MAEVIGVMVEEADPMMGVTGTTKRFLSDWLMMVVECPETIDDELLMKVRVWLLMLSISRLCLIFGLRKVCLYLRSL